MTEKHLRTNQLLDALGDLSTRVGGNPVNYASELVRFMLTFTVAKDGDNAILVPILALAEHLTEDELAEVIQHANALEYDDLLI